MSIFISSTAAFISPLIVLHCILTAHFGERTPIMLSGTIIGFFLIVLMDEPTQQFCSNFTAEWRFRLSASILLAQFAILRGGRMNSKKLPCFLANPTRRYVQLIKAQQESRHVGVVAPSEKSRAHSEGVVRKRAFNGRH